MPLEIKDNSGAIKLKLQGNIKKALTAMGQVGVETTLDVMNTKYGKPIYKTGDLQRSVAFKIDVGKQETTWGSNLTYAPYVHEGTSRMAARPFLKDGILGNKNMLREVAAEELKEGF